MTETENETQSEQAIPPNTPQIPLNWNGLKQVILERRIDFALWVTRALTIIFAIGYVFPLLG
jgi:uncharacterized RDD family membrane protein YckC